MEAIKIKEKKLRAAIQIAFAEHGLEDDQLENKIVQYSKNLSLSEVAPKQEQEEWISVEEKLPITFETGHWDGKRSEIVVVKNGEDSYHICRLYSGFMDGFEFNDWAEAKHDLIVEDVTHWKNL